MTRAKVVLPLPDSPTRPSVSPARSSRSTSLSARISRPSCLNVLLTSSAAHDGRVVVARDRGAQRRGAAVVRGTVWASRPEVAAAAARLRSTARRSGSCSRQIGCTSPQRSAKTQPSSFAPIGGRRARDRVEPALVLAHAGPWQAAQQADGVGVARVLEDVAGRALLDQPPGVEHADAVAHVGDDAEVVADEEHARAELLAQVRDEVEHLGLHGGVEARGRLVEDQQRRVRGQRHGDHDALQHAARELVRVPAHDRLGIGDLHLRQRLARPAGAPRAGSRRRW